MFAVLRNAVNNALRYAKPHTTVSIHTKKQPDDGVEITVSNISQILVGPDLIDALNSRQAVDSLVDDQGHKGMGIGHLIIHEMMERNGGTVHYQAVENKVHVHLRFLP